MLLINRDNIPILLFYCQGLHFNIRFLKVSNLLKFILQIAVKRSRQFVFVNEDQQKSMTREINSLIEDIHDQEYR
jgi:hypothetical protein